MYHHIISNFLLSLGDHFQPCAIISIGDILLQYIACGRTASPGLVTVARGLVLYMDTSIYTFHADQGSLESISKDFPCVRYVVLLVNVMGFETCAGHGYGSHWVRVRVTIFGPTLNSYPW